MKEEEEKIKEAMTEALIHLEGCKYFVATIVNEEECRFDMSQRMSPSSTGFGYKRCIIK